jgi:hypothetical protein
VIYHLTIDDKDKYQGEGVTIRDSPPLEKITIFKGKYTEGNIRQFRFIDFSVRGEDITSPPLY